MHQMNLKFFARNDTKLDNLQYKPSSMIRWRRRINRIDLWLAYRRFQSSSEGDNEQD